MRRSILMLSLLLLSCANNSPTGPDGGTDEGPDSSAAGSYNVVDTGQRSFYDDQNVISAPLTGLSNSRTRSRDSRSIRILPRH